MYVFLFIFYFSVIILQTLSKSEEQDCETTDVTSANFKIEPQIDWHVVEALYAKFDAVFTNYCEVSLLEKAQKIDAENYDVRRLIKHVADIIWNTLSKAQYKDRPHLQSIYSYLTGNFTIKSTCSAVMATPRSSKPVFCCILVIFWTRAWQLKT